MKNSLILFFIFLFTNTAFASGASASYYFDSGIFYSGSKFPQSAAYKTLDTNKEIKLKDLKQGKSSIRNFFSLVEVGNASIDSAAKNGNIKKIHYADTKINKVNVPLFIIPVYVKQKTTIVYGE